MGTLGIASGDDLGKKICEGLGLEHIKVRRVILDCEVGALTMAYIELYGSDKLLEIDWKKGLNGAQIVILDKQETTEE